MNVHMVDNGIYMDCKLASRVLMIGDYAGEYAAGGMASVIHNYRRYIPGLIYIYTWRPSSSRIYKFLILLRSYIQVLLKLAFDRNIALVHIHTCSGASFRRSAGFMKLAKFFGKKILLHMHGGRFRDFYEESVSKDGIIGQIAMSDRFAVLSDMWMHWFVSIGVDRKKICVLNNMVLPPADMTLRHNDGCLDLLFLGSVVKTKGIYDLLDVVAVNVDRWKGRVSLKIAGEVTDDTLERTIHERKLEDVVTYCGYATGHKKDELLAGCDVFVLPSYFEGLPMSILEAMSWSKAVIASRVGGIPSVVHDGVNGILIEPADKDALTSAVESFVSDPDMIREYGLRSAEIVVDYFPEKVMTELSGIYISLMNQEEVM